MSKIFPIMINCKCPNRRIITSNDGRRSQQCTVCKQKWSADTQITNRKSMSQPDYVFPNMLETCCNNPKHMMSDNGNKEQECLSCHMSWSTSSGYVNKDKSNDKPRSKSESSGIRFVCYPIQTDCCSKPLIKTSRDGHRNQSCSNCNWSWSADPTDYDITANWVE